MKEMYFYLDCLPFYFKGYSYGGDWNGFACPLFDKDTTIQILKKMKEFDFNIDYTIVNDTIIVKQYDDEEVYTPNNSGFYGLGAYSWTWDEISENDLKEQIWNSYKDDIVKWGD